MTAIADVGVKLISHPIKKCFSNRCVKGIPPTDFISDIKQYHTVLKSLLDRYVPIKTKKITPKTPNPWMTMKIKLA